MKFRDFALMTDQNIHPDVIAWLRAEAFDVLELGQARLLGSTDDMELARAFAENRVVVTHDSDFGSLAVPQGAAFVGIVYIRPGHVKANQTIDSFEKLLCAHPELNPRFILVLKRSPAGVAIRIRQNTP